jgi:hypothetical protein
MMRKLILLGATALFICSWMSSCALHRHRIEQSDHSNKYWNHHGGNWYK